MPRIITSGKRVSGTGRVFAVRSEACIHTLPESVVSLITWRPRCSEEAAVPLSGQTTVKEGRCFNAGTSVARDNRLATSVQTHFFDSGSAAAVGRQERWTQRSSPGSPKGEEGGRWRTSRATVAREGRTLCGAAHWGGDLRAGEKVREHAGVEGARAR